MDITTLVPKTRSRASENEEISVRFWNGKEAKVSKGVTFWIPSSLYERTVRELPELQLWRRALCVQRCDEQLQLGRSTLRVQRCDEQLQLRRTALSRALASRTNQ
ncbi:UNVERIFIED_CONTAM: hypothetical protein FKN15_041713 [Acipenser sinensis]